MPPERMRNDWVSVAIADKIRPEILVSLRYSLKYKAKVRKFTRNSAKEAKASRKSWLTFPIVTKL